MLLAAAGLVSCHKSQFTMCRLIKRRPIDDGLEEPRTPFRFCPVDECR